MQFLDSRTRYGGAYGQDSWKVKPELHPEPRPALGSQHALVRHSGQDRDDRSRRAIHQFPDRSARAGWCRAILAFRPPWRPRTTTTCSAPGLAYSPGLHRGILGQDLWRSGKTSIRASFGIYYTSIEDLNLFYEVGDPPYGNNWQSPNGVLFEEPYRTRTDGVSQGQKFPFTFPTPNSPANKTLNFAQYLPISYAPGYDIHNRMPYAEHYNFSIERRADEDPRC